MAVALTDISKQKKLETALAVANDNLFAAYKEIRIFAETDALTGLVNRYGLQKFFEREIRRCPARAASDRRRDCRCGLFQALQ